MEPARAVVSDPFTTAALLPFRDKLEHALVEACQRLYGSRLWSVALYGSTARGTFSSNSDVDFVIVAEPLPSGRLPRVREFDQAEHELQGVLKEICLAGWRIALSPIFKTRAETQFGSPLFLDMVEDARILLDREQFFANRLEQLRRRLKELGARRIWKGNQWHWDLKPDWKPGDVIEL